MREWSRITRVQSGGQKKPAKQTGKEKLEIVEPRKSDVQLISGCNFEVSKAAQSQHL